MQTEIENFIQERVYLKSVTAATVKWYRSAFLAFAGATETLESAKTRIVELRTRGLSPVSVNVHLRCINAFWRWQGKDWKIPRLKEEQKILATLSVEQMKLILNRKFTSRTNLRRAHLVALTILDTGLRASEVLGLTKENVDLQNLVFRVTGKGNKQRLVPFSHELRKALYRFISQQSIIFIFGTKNNTKVSVRNLERDFDKLGKKVGITGVRFSPHTLRHSFAVQWLRNGGDIYKLSRILGHSSITTTTVYVRSLGIDDLSNSHQRFSPLNQMKGSIR